MRYVTVMALAGSLAACSDMHVFEVEGERAEPSQASLMIYGTASDMQRVGTRWVGRRRGGDGSGRISLTFSDGRTTDCPIGYVTKGDQEPHRFAIRNGICEPND